MCVRFCCEHFLIDARTPFFFLPYSRRHEHWPMKPLRNDLHVWIHEMIIAIHVCHVVQFAASKNDTQGSWAQRSPVSVSMTPPGLNHWIPYSVTYLPWAVSSWLCPSLFQQTSHDFWCLRCRWPNIRCVSSCQWRVTSAPNPWKKTFDTKLWRSYE